MESSWSLRSSLALCFADKYFSQSPTSSLGLDMCEFSVIIYAKRFMRIQANNPGKVPLQPHFTSTRHLHSQCSGMQASCRPHVTEHRGVQLVVLHVSRGQDTESSRCCSCSSLVTAMQDKPSMHTLLGPPYLCV